MVVKFFLKGEEVKDSYWPNISEMHNYTYGKSPEHLGYIDEIHRLNTEFDVILLIQSIQTIQSSRVDDWTVADYIRVWLNDSHMQTLVDCNVVQCTENWRIAQSCNADIWEWYSRAMQTSRDCRLGQTLGDCTYVQLKY